MSAEHLPARSRIVHDHLTAAGVHAQVRVLPDSARTAALAADAIGCEVGAIANSLVMLADDRPILVMTSGAHRADLDVLARSIGAGKVTMAPPAVVRSATGQVIGGVAPVGHPSPLPTYLDEDLAAFPQVWTAGGTPETVMPLTFDELASVTGGEIIAVV